MTKIKHTSVTRYLRTLAAAALAVSAFALSATAQTADATPKQMTRTERADRMLTAPVETFYLEHATAPNDGNEILTALRLMLDPSIKIFLMPAQNAILVRALPDDMALARKLIAALDRPRANYRVNLTMTETDGGRPVSVQHASLTMERGQRSTLKRGIRLPIVTGSVQTGGETQNQMTYLDVGLNLDLTLNASSTGGSLLYKVEQSSPGDEKSPVGAQDPVVHQTTVQGVTVLASSKAETLCSVDVLGTTHKLTLDATLEPVH